MWKGKVILEKCLLVSRISKDDLYDVDCGKEIFQESQDYKEEGHNVMKLYQNS